MWRPLVLLLSLLLVSLPLLEGGRSKTIDYAALEKAWEAGDDQQELRTEGDEHYRQLADKNEEEAKALGPQMIFVTMKDGHSEPLPDVASRWKEMLWNGGAEVNIYEVADSKLLVGLQKGIFVNDVMAFLDEQSDVNGYEWNGKAYSKHGHRLHRHKKGPKQLHQNKDKVSRTKGMKLGKDLHAKRKHPHRKPSQTAKAIHSKTTEKRSNDEL
ncbi:hypothetical protein PHYPSEUDO_007373 [Phytophthora pseudosyringae]|uniref:Mesoderm development candidate 2 n=1 Tax=Phytophthora pseudosyringae TaxID=221518 RepID=A0A8T1WJE2_9STRA|nr:hypothetical protein PHYPSEUDO_007373 [Phytophthora pseudosyringae]